VRLLAQAVVGNRKDWQWAQVEPPLFDARHVVLLGGRHEGHTLPDPPQHWSKGNGRPLMGYLETIFEAAERLGGDVDKQLKPARDLRARADELNRQPDQARSAEEKAYGELVEAIAAGRVPPGEAAKAAGTWIFDSQASKTIVAAVSVCHTEAAAVAREAGPRIFAALQRRVAGIVDESVKRSVELPRGVDSEAKALRANGDRKALDTWERLRALVDEWTGCHELPRTMQLAGWVPGPTHPRDRDGARLIERYEKPLLPAAWLHNCLHWKCVLGWHPTSDARK
jgi:hypothetical protein